MVQEGNILPLNSFRAMFPHALDANGYPRPGFLRGSKTTLECYDDGKLVNHGQYQTQTPALLRKVISRPFILHCRDQDTEANHHWSPSQHQVRPHMSVMQKHFQVCFSYRENDRKQHQELLSRPLTENRWQNLMETSEEQI